MPALPLDEAGKYVAGAYVVFLTLIIVYIAILGAKISRVEREVTELLDELEGADADAAPADKEKVPQELGRSPGVQASRDGEQSSRDAGLEAPRR